MIQTLLKLRIQYIFGLAGILFIFLSMFSVQDITKLNVTFVEQVRVLPLIAGGLFILLSLALHIAPHLTIPLSWTSLSKISTIEDGFRTTIAHASIDVCFGRIEQLYELTPQALVALPANDMFDDDCIHDPRSALGAFVNQMFPNQIHDICRIARNELKHLPKIGNDQGASISSRYEIGTTVYFDCPLNKNLKMAFVATTSVTQKEGIRCEAPSIFNAVNGVHKLMNEQRLDTVILPVMGSGHGGLRPPISLTCMLIAFSERLREPSGRHIRSVRIVVYQKDKRTATVISRGQVRRLLAFVYRYCQQQD